MGGKRRERREDRRRKEGRGGSKLLRLTYDRQ